MANVKQDMIHVADIDTLALAAVDIAIVMIFGRLEDGSPSIIPKFEMVTFLSYNVKKDMLDSTV